MKHSLFRSIRFRLTIGYVFVLFLSLVLFTIFFYQVLNKNVTSQIKSEIQSTIDKTVSFIQRQPHSVHHIINELNQNTILSDSRYPKFYAFFDEAGNILAKTESYAEDVYIIHRLRSDEIIEVTFYETRFLDYDGQKQIALTYPIYINNELYGFLQMGVSYVAVQKILNDFLNSFIWVIPFLLLLAGLGGFYLASRALKPIKKIISVAQEISIQKSDVFLPVRGAGDELDELADTFNQVFDRLYNSYKRIAQFTQDASHELRIPITTLKGEAQVVLEREREPEEYRRVFESSIEEYDRLTQMLNDLLTLSRSDNLNHKLEKVVLDLKPVLEHLLEFFQPLAAQKGIKFKMDFPDGMNVLANKLMVERLFSNLLDNAIKYTFDNDTIEMRAKISGDTVEISVEDHGTGIPKKSLAMIFERFYRVEKSRSRELGGVGLGLSIVKMICDVHDAQVTVRSEEKVGTTFCVQFPLI